MWFQNMTSGHITSSPSGNIESLKVFGEKIIVTKTKKRVNKWQKLHDSVYPKLDK